MSSDKLAASEAVLAAFMQLRDSRSFRRLMDLGPEMAKPGSEVAKLWRRFEQVVLIAAGSEDWRLARAGINGLWLLDGHTAEKADIIAAALLSRYGSVREAAWGAIWDASVARAVLSRLEELPARCLLSFEVLMAVDQMAVYLQTDRARERLRRLARRLEQCNPRSRDVAGKIQDTLCCHLRP